MELATPREYGYIFRHITRCRIYDRHLFLALLDAAICKSYFMHPPSIITISDVVTSDTAYTLGDLQRIAKNGRETGITHARESLYIKRGKVSVRNIRTSVTVGVASSVANDVTKRVTS